MTGKYEKIDWDSVEMLGKPDNCLKQLYVFERVNDSLEKRTVHDLSAGARDQFLFSCRLGFIETLFGNSPHFIIFDDPFANYDPDRFLKAMETLKYLADINWQVIYLSWRCPEQ